MVHGGKKFEKTSKSKFKKYDDTTETLKQKKKHHDKTTYRLKREEEREILV
jgi:hypothetical protein